MFYKVCVSHLKLTHIDHRLTTPSSSTDDLAGICDEIIRKSYLLPAARAREELRSVEVQRHSISPAQL